MQKKEYKSSTSTAAIRSVFNEPNCREVPCARISTVKEQVSEESLVPAPQKPK